MTDCLPIALTPAKCMQIALRSIERARVEGGDTVPGRELAMMVVIWCVRGEDDPMSAEVARHAWGLFLSEIPDTYLDPWDNEDDYMLVDDLVPGRKRGGRVGGQPEWLKELARDATQHLRKLGRRLPRVFAGSMEEEGWGLWTHSPVAVRRWLETQNTPAKVTVHQDIW